MENQAARRWTGGRVERSGSVIMRPLTNSMTCLMLAAVTFCTFLADE